MNERAKVPAQGRARTRAEPEGSGAFATRGFAAPGPKAPKPDSEPKPSRADLFQAYLDAKAAREPAPRREAGMGTEEAPPPATDPPAVQRQILNHEGKDIGAEIRDALFERKEPRYQKWMVRIQDLLDLDTPIFVDDFDDLIEQLESGKLEPLLDEIEAREREEASEALAAAMERESAERARFNLQLIRKAAIDPWISTTLGEPVMAEVIEIFARQFGARGAPILKSSRSTISFRGYFKDSARDLAEKDYLKEASTATVDAPVSLERLRSLSTKAVYKAAKEPVNQVLTDFAEQCAAQLLAELGDRLRRQAARSAASVLVRDSLRFTAAMESALETLRTTIPDVAKHAKTLALQQAKEVLKDFDKSQLLSQLEEAVSATEVGKKAFKAELEAATAAAGLGLVGDTLDKLIPAAGDQITFEIGLKIPAMPPAYALIKLTGFAARGIEGAATSGYAALAKNPAHLEVSATIALGGGVSTGLLDAEAALKTFARAGADSTAGTMDALSYAVFRTVPEKVAVWWKGGWRSDLVGAEKWAAEVEKRVFAGDETAYGEVGLGVEAGIEAGIFEGSADFSAFKRYSKGTLTERSDEEGGETPFATYFAEDVDSAAVAKERRKKAEGATVKSFAASFQVTPLIAKQAVSFAVAASAERSGSGKGKGFWTNFGVELSGTMGYSPTDATQAEQIAVGLVGAGAVVARRLIKIAQQGKDKDLAQRAVLMKESWDLSRAAMQKQLSKNVAKIGGSSALTLAIVFGLAGGEFNWRVDARQTDAGGLTLGFGGLKVSVAYEKVSSLASFGVESGHVVGQVLGVGDQ